MPRRRRRRYFAYQHVLLASVLFIAVGGIVSLFFALFGQLHLGRFDFAMMVAATVLAIALLAMKIAATGRLF